MKKIIEVFFFVLIITFLVNVQSSNAQIKFSTYSAPFAPIPAIPAKQLMDSMPLGDWKSFPEMKLDIPVTAGPFEPTWESIEKNYPGEPAWLRDAKFGIWVHFGPQSAGESGDWYARRLYSQGTVANKNHL
jgi:alpha-L-fucosidase